VYGRRYAGRELRFEASGGLLHSALVMRDKETGSYWPIMTGAAITGEYKGTRLEELPVGVKVEWRDWVAAHPETRVLSVGGVEHVENNPYDNYMGSGSGFQEAEARDRRLPTKAPVYAFQLDGAKYAVPFRAFTEGGVFEAGGRSIFLFRPPGVALYYSTRAFSAPSGGFERRGDGWYDRASGARFEPRSGEFAGGQGARPARLEGFDTFWYIWSLTHPGTMLLGQVPARR
jgi:hypothetical protein